MTRIDRKIFFDEVRDDPFPGRLTTSQVEGMEGLLDAWELGYSDWDLRWFAYALATTYLETAHTMQPIEEIGKGKGKAYGKPDPNTGEIYYGRGFVQLTWATNYQRADRELSLAGDASCYRNAENALRYDIASPVLFEGMAEGWFRSNKGGQPYRLETFFNEERDDPLNAREIINGDKNIKPKWGRGKTIGEILVTYHKGFLDALTKSASDDALPPSEPEPVEQTIVVSIDGVLPNQHVILKVNGVEQ